MLKEGWDVRNVTTIVGLRAYAAQEQHPAGADPRARPAPDVFRHATQRETVSVMGTPAFMEFVESIQSEGVTFERVPMGGRRTRTAGLAGRRGRHRERRTRTSTPSTSRCRSLTRRYHREFKDLDALDPATFGNPKLPLKPFTPEETREIVFKTMLDAEIHHTIQLDGTGPADYRSVVAFFARQLLKDLRLVGGYDVLYRKVQDLHPRPPVHRRPVDLEDPVILRNLSEPEVGKVLFDHFRAAINALTIHEGGSARIEERIRLRDTRPFRTEPRGFLPAKKSVFNQHRRRGQRRRLRTGLRRVPRRRARTCRPSPRTTWRSASSSTTSRPTATFPPTRRISSCARPTARSGSSKPKAARKSTCRRRWRACANGAKTPPKRRKDDGGPRYRFVYVDQEGFEQHKPSSFADWSSAFREYQED